MQNRFYIIVLLLATVACRPDYIAEEPQHEIKKDSVVIIPSLVQSPVKELDPVSESHEIDAEQGGDIQIINSKGSVISIPANVLVDSAGNFVKGKVTVTYREMHNAATVFLSGVPLDYNASGMMKRFETAGMFEIRAMQNNRNVFVDSGKVITVNFAGKILGGEYHLFYLNENTTRNWHFIGDEGGHANPEKTKLLNTQREKNMSIPLGKDFFTFNYMAALDIYYNDNEKLIEQNRNNPATRSKISEYGITWTNIYNYQSIEFEGKKYLASMLIWKNISGKAFPAWSAKSESKLVQVHGNIYEVSIDDKSGNIFSARIEAFMPVKTLFAKTAAEWKQHYDQTMAKIKSDEARIAQLADVYRTMKIHEFGYYSYDRYLNDENSVTVIADFRFEDSTTDRTKIKVYYVSGSNRSLVCFPYEKWNDFILIPDANAKIFALLPDQQLAVFGSADYRKIDFKKLKEETTPTVIFEMKNAGKLTSSEDLFMLLGIGK